MAEAKELILSGNISEQQWHSDTAAVMPRLLTEVVKANLPGYDACMEIGAGIGRILRPMNDVFQVAAGCDISPVMVSYSEGYLKGTKNAWVRLTDGTFLPAPDDSTDFVYVYICFQHLQSYDEVRTYLSEAARILKPNGVIRIQTHCGEPNEGFQGFHGCYYPSLTEFENEFTKAGFKILESERGFETPDTLWVTAQKEL